jgi:hypothetical protein
MSEISTRIPKEFIAEEVVIRISSREEVLALIGIAKRSIHHPEVREDSIEQQLACSMYTTFESVLFRNGGYEHLAGAPKTSYIMRIFNYFARG